MMDFKLETSDFQAIALFQFKLGRRVAETCRDMVTAFGGVAPPEQTVQTWFLQFQWKNMAESTNSTTPIYFPFGNRYDRIDKRYKFTCRTDLLPLALKYPLRCGEPMDAEYGHREVHSYQREIFKISADPSNIQEMPRTDIFPDVVLMTIFKYMHPVDLVNGVSGVSVRWNKLANVPSNYTDVRVIIDAESIATGSAKAFLQRGANCIRRLCLDYARMISPGCVADILPDCMPNVTLLDISCFIDLGTNVDALIRCFPNVEILSMEKMANADEVSFAKLFSEHAFPRIRRLYFGADGFHDGMVGKLLTWKRSIEVLRLLNVEQATMFGLQQAEFIPTLTELYVESVDLTNSAFARIGQLRNLKKLCICIGYDATDAEVLQLKNLCNLEHLHMHCSGEDSEHGMDSIIELFQLPDRNASKFFPYRLKHLLITGDPGFRHEALGELAKSCPDLMSLNISYDNFYLEDLYAMVVQRFRKLRFLEMNRIEGSFDELRELSDDDLPDLQFLGVRHTPVSEEVLEELSKKRPKLIISNRRNYFLNGVIQDGKTYINREFLGDLNAVLNDLSEIDGFCCMGNVRSQY